MTTQKEILDYVDRQPAIVKGIFSTLVEKNKSFVTGSAEFALKSMADKNTGEAFFVSSQIFKNLDCYSIEEIVEANAIATAAKKVGFFGKSPQ